MKRPSKRVLWTIAVLPLTGLVYWELPHFFPCDFTAVWRYHQLRHLQVDPLMDHFPSEIPGGATHVRFYYFRGFMQGNPRYQLRLRLPPDQIDALYQTFAARRTQSFFGGDVNEHSNGPDGMFTTYFFTNDQPGGSFPPSYEVMVFDKLVSNKERSDVMYRDRARSHGVAISKEQCEIVYWTGP